jgi:hypothetical protein
MTEGLMMRTPSFEIRRDGAIAEIILNRPNETDSLVENFWVEFPETIRELDRDGGVRVAILRGEGRKQPASYRDLLPIDAPAIPRRRTSAKRLTDVQ